MVIPEQLEDLAAAFAALGALHRAAPSSSELAAFRALQGDWPLADTSDARDGLAALRRSAEADETAEQIRADHARLYGDAARALVAPYESVHRSIERLVFDEATLQVRAAYAQLGLAAPRLNREPDDHIGLEFDFLAQAFLLAADRLAQDHPGDAQPVLDAAASFLRDHLEQWAPAMLTQVVAKAGTQFMAGVALLSRGALASAVSAVK